MNVTKQQFPITVTHYGNENLVAKLDYFRNPQIIKNMNTNIVPALSNLDSFYLSIVEQLLEKDYVDMQFFHHNLSDYFPNPCNLLSKEGIIDKEFLVKSELEYRFVDKSGLFIAKDIPVIDMPKLIAMAGFVAIYGAEVETLSFIFMRIRTISDKDYLRKLLEFNKSNLQKLVVNSTRELNDLTVEDFDFVNL